MFDAILNRMRGLHRPALHLNTRREPDFQPTNKVAFEAAPIGNQLASPAIPILFPTRTRHVRLDSDIVVFVLYYADFGMCARYIQLHGRTKAEYGDKIPMDSVEVGNKRLDDIVAEAARDAVGFIYAVRNPVIGQPMPDELPPRDAVAEPPRAPKHFVAQALLTTPVSPGLSLPHGAIGQFEGEFLNAGQIPYTGPQGQLGKPSYCVLLRSASGKELKCFGSDLQGGIRESGALPGDVLRLTKFPKVAVVVGNRTVNKNLWTVDIIAKP